MDGWGKGSQMQIERLLRVLVSRGEVYASREHSDRHGMGKVDVVVTRM